jgi:hypothetical protein
MNRRIKRVERKNSERTIEREYSGILNQARVRPSKL